MKKTKLWLTTIVALLCSLTAGAEDFSVDGIYYNITSSTDLTVAVTYRGYNYNYYSNEYSGAVTVPETVTYNNNTYSVTSIGDYAFYKCSSLTSITLPESVTSIGEYAFSDCSSLYKVINCSNLSLSKGSRNYGDVAYYAKVVYQGGELTTVGDYQFYTSNGIYSLVNYIGNDTEIVLPDCYNGENYKIGDCAFSGCSRLTSITIPEGVTSSGNHAFSGCSRLTSITIPESVTSIGNYAFSGCSRLTSITIPEGVTSIGNYAFYSCSSLTSITLPEGVTSIGNHAFSGCSSLTSITLPEGVTSIGEDAFSDCSSLTSITLPEGVTSIGEYTFYGCTSLTAINIPEGVTSIGDYAFYSCSSLYKVINCSNLSLFKGSSNYGYVAYYAKVVYQGGECTTVDNFQFYASNSSHSLVNYIGNDTEIGLPDSYNGENYEIGDCAFYGCRSLTSITLPEGVTSIGDYAFQNCTDLKKVIIEDGCSTLSLGYNGSSQGLFYNCPLEEVYLGRNLSYSSGSSYGYSPFYESNRFPTISLGNNVTSIPSYLFYNDTSLTSITLPEGVTSIGDYAFRGCSSLTSITIPYSVTSIGEYAFCNCSRLTSVTLPEGVTSIGNYAFDNCTALKKVIIEDGGTTLSLGYSYYYSNGTGHGLFYDCPLEEVYLGRNLSYSSDKSYGYSPFYNKDELANVTIGNEVTQISEYAFYGCDNIHSLTISSGVLSIGNSAFRTPEKVIWLTNTPPTGYTNAKGSINYAANDQHSSLSNVKVYPYLSSMFEVDGVKYVPVSPSERTCHAIDCAYNSTAAAINVSEKASFKGIAMTVKEVMPYAFYGNKHIKEVNISHKGNIGDYAFYDCDGIKSLDISNVGYVGDEAFRGCTSLQEIIIPSSVTSVGASCFRGCSAMKSAVIGDGVKSIGDYAFQGCSSLPAITIPQAVTKIGDYVFAGCSKLADVIIADRTTALSLGSNGSSPLFTNCPLDSVYIGGKITYSTTSSKGYSPFYRNTSLRSVVITDREEQIYDNEFYGCTNLQNVSIGNGVKSIGNYAFSGCSSLAGFSFGSNMETIGAEAFSDCTNLTSITSHAAVPPTCGTQALDDINKWECVLGVPLGNADAYYAADQWKEFFFIEDVVEVDHYVLTYVVDGEVVHTEVLKHKDEVTMLAEPTKVGYEFSGWDKTLTTMPAEDVIISGTFTRLPVDNLVILDTEENFLIDEEMECETVTYIRHFDDTQWQALYLPFAIPYDSLYKEFEVAYINDMHQFDDDNNGTIDRTEVEAIKIVEGMLKANYPYLIKAKSIGEKSIVVADATLYATEENSVDCSSVFTNYTFTGSYSTLSGEELAHDEGYYVLSDGMWQPLAEGASLGAFRIYLKIESRDGNNAILSQAAIRMRVVGDEENEDDATGIENSTGNGQQATVYDLQGRKVLNTDNLKGIYIVDGKKVVFF